MITINSLHWRDLSFSYESGESVFENVDFIFPQERVIGIETFGAKGKSTLLRLLMGLLVPQSGDYFVNEQSVTEMSFEEFLPYRLRMSYAFDLGGLLNNKTLQENITLPLVYHNICDTKEIESRLHKLAELFELGPYLNLRPSSVTGSFRKITCLVRSLITEPEVLLLDDPTTGLSQNMVSKLMQVLQSSTSIKQIFIASQDKLFLKGIVTCSIEIHDKKLQVSPATPALKEAG